MENIFILVVWFLMGAATGMVAEKKNRDTTLWFVLGILGGFIALFVVLVLPPV
ncbi:hypothetical protein [Roseofilum capinflatum]|uniref:Uncharacterized protein n=1 Tax=Roseofilum capinflatum BLCC-M114 TaxID=3022440 RepID=A0ABT7B9X0_9CYAN|nr:hypothetical protein [Roseofilum capinflatum]MDJ1175966.1 hypothetical protein [Roseofilum capinflatum BLCC-M114]